MLVKLCRVANQPSSWHTTGSKYMDKKWSSFFRRFFPWFIIAALLPVVIFAATSRDTYSLFSLAAETNQLTVYPQPGRIITSVGKSTPVQLIGEFDSEAKLISSVTIDVISPDPVMNIQPQTLTFPSPFQGKVKLGSLDIVASRPGTWEVRFRGSAKDGKGQIVDVTSSPLTIYATE